MKIRPIYFVIILLLILYPLMMSNRTKPVEIKKNMPSIVYNDSKEFINQVNICADYLEKDMDKSLYIPRKILLAQAILESDYGNSRFALEGNNLFGVMTFDLTKPHLKPKNDTNSNFGAKSYETKCDSVYDYMQVLNHGTAFKEFRALRQNMILNNNLDVLNLVTTLTKYATNPNYVYLLQQIIKSLNKNY